MPDETGKNRRVGTLLVHFWLTAVLAATADLLSKHLIFGHLAKTEQQPIYIIRGFLRIVHSENRGGVFGLGQGSSMWPLLGLAASLLVIWFAHREDFRNTRVQIALGLVLGGAIGNLFDRMVIGYVRDFIDVYVGEWHWPAFNVADSGICIGAFYLAIYAFLWMPKDEKQKQKRKL